MGVVKGIIGKLEFEHRTLEREETALRRRQGTGLEVEHWECSGEERGQCRLDRKWARRMTASRPPPLIRSSSFPPPLLPELLPTLVAVMGKATDANGMAVSR